MRPDTEKSPGSKGQLRQETIADAAERLFCIHGYYGTSMREIAGEAGINLGLINYYFDGKEQLFRFVVLRRRDALHDIVDASLGAAVEAARPGRPDAAALIRAFVEPFIDLLRHENPGWAHYIKLTSQVLALYHVPALAEAMASLRSISQLFIDRLRDCYPTLDDANFYAIVYAVESVMSFIVQDPGFLDSLTLNHHHSAAMDRLLDYLVPFLAGGAEALATRPVRAEG